MARSKSKAVVEEDLEELDELEEVEEAPAPRKKASKKAAAVEEKPKRRRAAADDDEESSAYGASWLADYINEATGKNYTAANIRVLLRKLAKDGVLDREVGEDRSRYAFTGPNDPIVKAALKHVKDGALEKEKAERLEAVKANKAAKKTGKKAAPEPEEDEDEDDDEVETPAPKKRATRRR